VGVWGFRATLYEGLAVTVRGVERPVTAFPVVVRLTRPFQRHAVGLVRLR